MSKAGGLVEGYWFAAHRADRRALALFLRHYSADKGRPFRRAGSPQFVAPGECLVLLTAQADALFVWHRARVARLDGQEGVCCAVFRNESAHRASDLLREAEQLAWARWPGARLFTYVDPARVAGPVPGYVFLRCRWRHAGASARGLLLLEKRPRP